eukprot:1249585-Pleurochrysis_carterae.AAC.1
MGKNWSVKGSAMAGQTQRQAIKALGRVPKLLGRVANWIGGNPCTAHGWSSPQCLRQIQRCHASLTIFLRVPPALWEAHAERNVFRGSIECAL